MKAKLTTRDIGLAIRDHLEDHDVSQINSKGEECGRDTVDFIDCSDADNSTPRPPNKAMQLCSMIAETLSGRRF